LKYSDALGILAEAQLSPEQLAPLIGISNMTYRRWMKRSNKDDEISTLHERGVREAISILRMKGLLPCVNTGEQPQIEQSKFFESVSQTIKSLCSAHPGPQSEGEEAFLRDLLQQIGAYSDALPTIQKSAHVFESFQKNHPRFGSDFNVLLYVVRTKGIPQVLKTVACGALLYFLTPVDMIPDFNFGVGYLDDYGVIAFAAAFCQTKEILGRSKS
jgi:uncharacterized membrane protein YkvA (DUF1232 family)